MTPTTLALLSGFTQPSPGAHAPDSRPRRYGGHTDRARKWILAQPQDREFCANDLVDALGLKLITASSILRREAEKQTLLMRKERILETTAGRRPIPRYRIHYRRVL